MLRLRKTKTTLSILLFTTIFAIWGCPDPDDKNNNVVNPIGNNNLPNSNDITTIECKLIRWESDGENVLHDRQNKSNFLCQTLNNKKLKIQYKFLFKNNLDPSKLKFNFNSIKNSYTNQSTNIGLKNIKHKFDQNTNILTVETDVKITQGNYISKFSEKEILDGTNKIKIYDLYTLYFSITGTYDGKSLKFELAKKKIDQIIAPYWVVNNHSNQTNSKILERSLKYIFS